MAARSAVRSVFSLAPQTSTTLRARLTSTRRATYLPRARLSQSAVLGTEGGLFGRLNPWARQTPESTIEPTEKKDDRRINLADVDELRVGQYDDEIPSWRATTQETDPTVIRKMIETILSDLTSTESSNLSTDSVLSDPTLKFNLLKRAIKELGKEIPSHKLGQLTTVDEVIAYFTETETPPLRVRDLFEQEGAFPPNVRFEEKH